jgi:hypothetical protein
MPLHPPIDLPSWHRAMAYSESQFILLGLVKRSPLLFANNILHCLSLDVLANTPLIETKFVLSDAFKG